LWIEDTKELFWGSERSGCSHLDLVDMKTDNYISNIEGEADGLGSVSLTVLDPENHEDP
jgi:hypothetical protein